MSISDVCTCLCALFLYYVYKNNALHAFVFRQGLLEQMNTDLGEEEKGEMARNMETSDPNISVLAKHTESSTNRFLKPLVPQVSKRFDLFVNFKYSILDMPPFLFFVQAELTSQQGLSSGLTSQQSPSSGLGYTFNSHLTAEENVLGWLRFLLETDMCNEAALQNDQPPWRFY